jgi:hypothetical protein
VLALAEKQFAQDQDSGHVQGIAANNGTTTATPTSHSGGVGQTGDTAAGATLSSPPLSTMGGQGQHDNSLSGVAQSVPNSGSGGNVSQIDAFFQTLNAMLSSLESRIEAMDPQTIAFFQVANAALDSLESGIAGHPFSI